MSTLFNSKFSQPLKVREVLQERGLALITPAEFQRLFKASAPKAKYFLETYTKKGLLVRLRRGLYALKDAQPSEEAIANALYQPSYISLEYALAKYGIIPEMPYTVTSVTTKATANFTVKGREFTYTRIKAVAFTGYGPEKNNGRTVFLAEPEKALVDYLYLVSLGKRSLNDRFYLNRLDKQKIKSYAKLFNRLKLDQLVSGLLK